MKVLGRVPFDLVFVDALIGGVTVVQYNKKGVADDWRDIIGVLISKLGKGKPK